MGDTYTVFYGAKRLHIPSMVPRKIGPNLWQLGDCLMSFEIGRPTLWQRFKMRFMPLRWERECDAEMSRLAIPARPTDGGAG